MKFQTFKQFAKGKRIVAMCPHRGVMLVATEHEIYGIGPDGAIATMAFEVHEGRDDQIGKTPDALVAHQAEKDLPAGSGIDFERAEAAARGLVLPGGAEKR